MLRRVAGRAALALLAVLGSAALLLATAAPAAAHAAVVATTPADQAVLEQAPATVTVRFSESVLATTDSLRVLAGNGSRVDDGDAATVPGDSSTISVALHSGLADGTYTAAWRVTSADSHPVHGAFTFSIGEPGPAAPLAGADRGSDPLLGTVMVITRGAGYAGLALLIGASGILMLLPRRTDRTRPRELVNIGGFLVIVTAGVTLLVQGPYADGYGPAKVLDSRLLHATLGERVGMALAARIVLAAVAMSMPAMGLIRPAPSRRERVRGLPAMLPVIAVAATFSATGHAIAGYQKFVAFPADVAHLMAMGLWLGGLTALCALYLQGSRPGLLAVAAGRFSPMAATCVGVLVVTGTYQGWRQTGTLDDLFTTQYGQLLVLKVTAVLVTLAMAFQARRWTRRHTGVTGDAAADTTSDAAGAEPVAAETEAAETPEQDAELVTAGAVAGPAVTNATAAGATGTSTAKTPARPDATAEPHAESPAGADAGAGPEAETVSDARPASGADPEPAPGTRPDADATDIAANGTTVAADGDDDDEDDEGDPELVGAGVSGAPALSTMRRTLLLESAGGVAVLVLTTLLAGSPPPRERVQLPTVPAAVQLKAGYDTHAVNGRGTVTARITPEAGGDATVNVSVTDSSGARVPAVEVSCSWSLPSLDIGPLSTSLKPDVSGHWQASSHLVPAGTWSLSVTVRTSDIDEATVTFPKVKAGASR